MVVQQQAASSLHYRAAQVLTQNQHFLIGQQAVFDDYACTGGVREASTQGARAGGASRAGRSEESKQAEEKSREVVPAKPICNCQPSIHASKHELRLFLL